jgi:hypothetical protein
VPGGLHTERVETKFVEALVSVGDRYVGKAPMFEAELP